MVEKDIEQDIGSYQSKFIGPLTFRQTVCLCISVPLCWKMYAYLTPILSKDLTGFLVAIPAFFCAAVGWFRPYGMKTEQYLSALIYCRILHPQKLRYQFTNLYEKEIQRLHEGDGKNQKKKKKYKVSPEAVR